MEDTPTIFEPLYEKVQAYGKTSAELYKLKAVEKTATLTSTIVSNGLVYVVLILCMSMAGIAAAFWLGEVTGRLYYGFLIIAGVYALFACILQFVLRNWIKKQTANSIVKQMLN